MTLSQHAQSAAKRALQQELVDYLNTDIDPYDYAWLISDWDASKENDFERLSDDEKKRFTAWLKKKRDDGYSEFYADPNAPAYLHFSHAAAAESDTWFVHFTDANPFFAFEHGASAEALALTRHLPERHRTGNRVRCPQNPSNGIFSTAYGFALDASDAVRHTYHYAKKYGHNAVLFKHAHAVQAYHIGDDEYQIIFPICGEYNVVPIHNVVSECLVLLKSGERTFDDLQAVIDYFDTHRVKTAFDGLPASTVRRVGYWAPGIAPPLTGSFSGGLFCHR